MTTHELIPVLKALHADPGCAPMLADWFEEHDDLPTALALRDGLFSSGADLIRTLVWKDHYTVRTSPGYFKLIPLASKAAIREAVIEEAMSRINWYELGDTDAGLDQDLRHTRGASEYLLGTQPSRWLRIPPHDEWEIWRPARYTCVSGDGNDMRRIQLRSFTVTWEPSVIALCGGWLQIPLTVWVGRDPFLNRPLVTKWSREKAGDPILKDIPF